MDGGELLIEKSELEGKGCPTLTLPIPLSQHISTMRRPTLHKKSSWELLCAVFRGDCEYPVKSKTHQSLAPRTVMTLTA